MTCLLVLLPTQEVTAAEEVQDIALSLDIDDIMGEDVAIEVKNISRLEFIDYTGLVEHKSSTCIVTPWDNTVKATAVIPLVLVYTRVSSHILVNSKAREYTTERLYRRR